MNYYDKIINNYLDYCSSQKRLNPKTIRAYTTDLKQFTVRIPSTKPENITPEILEKYIRNLHLKYKPRTVKRKKDCVIPGSLFRHRNRIISYIYS